MSHRIYISTFENKFFQHLQFCSVWFDSENITLIVSFSSGRTIKHYIGLSLQNILCIPSKSEEFYVIALMESKTKIWTSKKIHLFLPDESRDVIWKSQEIWNWLVHPLSIHHRIHQIGLNRWINNHSFQHLQFRPFIITSSVWCGSIRETEL